MPAFSEETLDNWRKPPSDAEENKLANAERMIKAALAVDEKLNKLNIEVYGQGSYANDTNVRLNSDIDINVRLMTTMRVDIPTGKTYEEYGYIDAAYDFPEFKNDVESALKKYFGEGEIERKDKCIAVKENSYRMEADVVPTLKHITHFENGNIRIGAAFTSDNGVRHLNYAQQHIENGKIKNAATGRRYKRVVRIFKRLRYRMESEGHCYPNITSFLLECLVYNVPNNVFNVNLSWQSRVKQSIISLYQSTESEASYKEWGEVSECLYLFHPGRRWSVEDVRNFLVVLWNYLGYGADQ